MDFLLDLVLSFCCRLVFLSNHEACLQRDVNV